MGIVSDHLHLLALEQAKHPIRGDVLTLGQQAVYATLENVENIFKSHNIVPKVLEESFDTKNRIPRWIGTPQGEFTNAQAVLTLLGAERVFATDISDYENPDYIIDFNHDVNEQYHERFDVILDIGTLEHIFDVPTALSNITKMLKEGGEVILILTSSNAIDHGFYSFSPTLFFDFFTINGFSNFSCYLREGSNYNYMKKGKIYRYNHIGKEYSLTSKNSVDVCFFATKQQKLKPIEATNLKNINKPLQNIYLSFYWNKKRYGREAFQKTNTFRKFLEKLEFYTSKFRPEFIDILWKSRKRQNNLTYLGRF